MVTLVAAVAASAPDAAAVGGRRSGQEWMQEAYRCKETSDAAGAARAFEAARASGVDAQRVDLELAYLSLEQGDPALARARLESVAAGPDPELATRAREQLRWVPRHYRGDLYADGYGWTGVAGDAHVANGVPTLRLRAHYSPWFEAGPSLYLAVQGTRDLASRGGPTPVIYSDNSLWVGPGLLLPLWSRRAGLFLQAGAAYALMEDGRPRTSFDARGGAFLGLESAGCTPAPASGLRLELVPCADLYSEAIWLGRFSDDTSIFARGRAGAGWLSTGPVAWQLLLEGRGFANRVSANGDDFVEAGVWHRWRLLRPLQLDALIGLETGRTVEVAGKAPARPGAYTELRFQLVTYMELF